MSAAAPYLFHPSSIGHLMTVPPSMDTSVLAPDELVIWNKSKRTTEEQLLVDEWRHRTLSAGAKTYLVQLAKEELFKYRKELSGREIRKGLMLEDAAIELLNHVHFQSYTKHRGRVENDLLTGECDIYQPAIQTRDTKVSWSIDTFPLLSEIAHDPMYEWQGRGYMHLYKVPRHSVDFCLLSTPRDLLGRADHLDAHQVDHIDPKMRVTSITYEHCPAKERMMLVKLKVAQLYLAQLIARARAEHGVVADWKQKFRKAH